MHVDSDLFVRFLQFYTGSRRNEVHKPVFLVNYMYICRNVSTYV